MAQEEHLRGLLSLSIGFWLLIFMFYSIRIHLFIVKRYEQETDLMDTVFFREHATFTRYLPNLVSSMFYKTHLLICIWGWKLYGKRKIFRDIDNPISVTKHFSISEIRRLKILAISALVVLFHMIVYVILLF